MKSLMQELWKLEPRVDWESDLPAPIVVRVNTWCTGLQELENVKIRRCYRRQVEIPADTQLHVITDTSELGFVAVTYLRFVYADDGVDVAFLIAKTHVAPVKKRTIPELELKVACEEVDQERVIADELRTYFLLLQDGRAMDQLKNMQDYRFYWQQNRKNPSRNRTGAMEKCKRPR